MASTIDEFEEFRTLAFDNRFCVRSVTSHDDCSNLHEKSLLQAKMRMRASFKSDNAYRARRRRQQEQQQQQQQQDDLVQRMTVMNLKPRDNIIGDSVISVFDSREEIDCDFPSPDGVSSDDDNNAMVTEFQEQSLRAVCASPIRISLDSPTLTRSVVPQMTSSPTTHHRSKSCRVRSRRPRELVEFQSSNEIRQRTYSMPSKSRLRRPRLSQQAEEQKQEGEGKSPDDNSDGDDSFYRVRTFCTSSKGGIINRGDSFKKRPLSAQSSLEGLRTTESFRPRTQSAASQDSSQGSSDSVCPSVTPHTVLVMGTSGVGKTALLCQFMSSEYMGNAETGIEEETLPSVSVLLDGSESTLEFAEISDADVSMHKTEVTSTCSAEAFLVIFAMNDRESYDDAVMCLHELRKTNLLETRATIFVANKGDIVRAREVTEEEAKVMAVRYGCKYIEVSAIMNLKVDELLVGTVQQIRLNDKRQQLRTKQKKSRSNRSTSCLTQDSGCIPQPKGIVGKIFSRHPNVFRSCDNLLVL